MSSASLTTLATAAAQFLGVLDSGEGLSTQQLADALAACNNMLDNWSSEGLFALSDFAYPAPLTQGVQIYSIGPAQAINQTRPMRIVTASFTNTSGPGGPVRVCTEPEWNAIQDRARQSYIIENLFYDRGFPVGSVSVSPVPQGSTLALNLHTWTQLTQFADTTTPITILPGYLRMIELGLAMEMAPFFDMAIPASVAAIFADAAGRVRKLNASLIGDIPEEVLQEAK